MDLSPEERRQIYEEEKARIEAREQIEQEKRKTGDPRTSTGLTPNVEGLLCYLGWWVTGIIFFVLEQKNNWVRFHAAQSILVLGAINVAGILLGRIPVVGLAFSIIVYIIGFILWIILMVKAYNGERYKLSWFGDIAERMIVSSSSSSEYQAPQTNQAAKETGANFVASGKIHDKTERSFSDRRGLRITGSAFAIAWSIALLIFFNFFNQYFAYYNSTTTGSVTTWTRYPFFNSEIHSWLPVLNAALGISILGHILMIIFDKRILNEIIHTIIDVFGLAAVVVLLRLFPFDFSGIPNATAASATQTAVHAVLIIISIGIGIGIIVRLVKLIVSLATGNTFSK